jgi:hypothetical protein
LLRARAEPHVAARARKLELVDAAVAVRIVRAKRALDASAGGERPAAPRGERNASASLWVVRAGARRAGELRAAHEAAIDHLKNSVGESAPSPPTST